MTSLYRHDRSEHPHEPPIRGLAAMVIYDHRRGRQAMPCLSAYATADVRDETPILAKMFDM
jgi:hypothetical protein